MNTQDLLLAAEVRKMASEWKKAQHMAMFHELRDDPAKDEKIEQWNAENTMLIFIEKVYLEFVGVAEMIKGFEQKYNISSASAAGTATPSE